MIKLIRTVRQKLLKEGKVTNYLKYAIGEILLVVIGIFLAVQPKLRIGLFSKGN